MVLPPHSSHLTQPLDVGVFSLLKTLIASVIEPLISTALHRILNAEWLSAYEEAHDKAFSLRNIQAGFHTTGILPYNPKKVLDHISPIVKELIIVHSSIPQTLFTPFKNSVLMSSPLYNEDAHVANAALLSQLSSGNALSTPARKYTQKVV